VKNGWIPKITRPTPMMVNSVVRGERSKTIDNNRLNGIKKVLKLLLFLDFVVKYCCS